MFGRFKRLFLLTILTSVIVMALVFVIARAGSLTPPAGPVGSTMHNMQELYNTLAGDAITFTGSGLNDMVSAGAFTGGSSLNYRIQIDAVGTPDTFEWSDDGGATWDATGVAITGLAQSLNNGVTITFTATAGHTLSDKWDFTRQSSNINGNILQQLKYISGMTLQQIYNNSNSSAAIITDSTANAVLTIAQTGAGNIIELKDETSAVFSIDKIGNISMGAASLTSADSVQIASGGESDLVLNSGSGKIKAAAGDAFYTAGGHPIRKSGEQVLISSVPIYRYSIPSQTNPAALAFIRISKYFAATSDISLPSAMEGTTRVYRLVINYADNIAIVDSTNWRIVNAAGTTVYDTFTLPGRNINMAVLPEGLAYLTEIVTVPDADWQIEFEVPVGRTFRIFNISLEAYDRVN